MKANKFLILSIALGLLSGSVLAQNIGDKQYKENQVVRNGRYFQAFDAANAKNIKVYDDGTDGVIDVSSGSVKISDPIIASGGITGAITGNADTATALAANPSDCTSGQFATAIAASGNLSCGALATDLAISTTLTNAAGASANPFDITSTLGIMNGSDDYTAIDLNITNANHTSTGNTVQALDISSITGDPDATETGINIGTGWDFGITSASAIKATGGIDFSGSNITGLANLSSSGTITSTKNTGVGAHKLSGANTACNTTCTTGGCLFGFDLSGGAAAPVLVECADATADTCLCMQ